MTYPYHVKRRLAQINTQREQLHGTPPYASDNPAPGRVAADHTIKLPARARGQLSYRESRFPGATESSIIRNMALPVKSEWNLHYSRWVIDDGEPERHVGETFEWFAVDFWPDAALIRSVETTKSAIPIADSSYRVNAEVIYISDDTKLASCILDFGLRAICDGVDVLPRGCQKGDYVTGELSLGLPLCASVYSDELTYHGTSTKCPPT